MGTKGQLMTMLSCCCCFFCCLSLHVSFSVVHTVVDSSVPHVMISYQWDAQKVMSKVKDTLAQAGYKVWMDVEHMSESCPKTC